MNKVWSLSTIRHGETDFNLEKRYAGRIDVTLNEKGKNETREASALLQDVRFDVILVSPLKRAVETAQLLFSCAGPYILAPEAQERDFGAMQGLTGREVERIRPIIHYVRIADDFHSMNPPLGETLEQVHERAASFFAKIVREYAGKRVAVISHGVFLQQFNGVVRGQDWLEALEYSVHNLELTTFHFEDANLVREEHMLLAVKHDTTW